MNDLKKWVQASREQEHRSPERYLNYYPELVCDDTHVLMTKETLDKINRNCGRYDGTLPTGHYLGKMFLRGDSLVWIGIHKQMAMTHSVFNSREIKLVD